MSDEHVDHVEEEEVEVVDGLPVLAEVRAVEMQAGGAVPTVQAAALAAGGFFAGAVTMALFKRLAARKLVQAANTLVDQPASATWPVGSSRTYVVNVRLVSRSD
ncbi:MAG TPA: hypothetical protein VG223_10400 [Solirubrobacteraceae bacterium]|nr:hypothetical protein [Solirubrobacteraceae bacterium]